ncbi:transcription factor bHLH111 isoform X2 [Phalaenopsis equestris]|uniref:transcription factor bHLH111 isoform X2 n=1 Tax=Phalaenopsis equestris TaxID=78828 RepID=UPI0009E46933|nr:transcription factor bHLH111 isoform X2 [Phalaenopsis equestris]
MAQEGSEASVASSSPAGNWWELGTNSMVPWNAMNHGRWTQQTHSSNLCQEDISISTNSGLSLEASSAAAGDHADNHIWNHVLLGVGSSDRSSKNLTTQMFNPVCDYLKKLDSSNWEFSKSSSSLNSFEKQFNSYNGEDLIDSERLTSNLSDLVSNWSIAPPNPNVDHQQISPSSCNVSMDPNVMAYTTSHVSHMKHENSGLSSFPNFQSYVHEVMKGDHYQQHELGEFSFGGLNNSVIGLNNSGLMADAPWSIPRNLSDIISFGSLNNACMKSSVSSESSKKAGLESYSSTKGSGRGSGTTSEGKKKRTDQYSSEALFKKPKHESSSASPLKLQVPKVKVADKITALQQIVSPFGKTDTASVLLEAINYIRFLQEQVQLLSDPYLKSSTNKDHSSWGSMERKEKVESKLDLRSRGLCLVPISSTPQAYRENNGPDYWTPPYRGCLYR